MTNSASPERRRHRLYTTRNTEYHLRDGICVAVRDRHSSCWRPGHIALNRRLEGGVKLFPSGAAVPYVEEPEPGDAIYFSDVGPEGEERQIVTSRLVAVGRPPKSDLRFYPAA